MPSRAITDNPTTGVNVGTAGTGVIAEEKGNGTVHQTVLSVSALSVVSNDETTSGAWGTHALYTFPRGLITILGAVTNLTLAKSGAGLEDDAAVVCAIGSVAATAGDTLSSTEADIVPSTACTLSSGAGAFKGQSTSTELAAGSFDGTTTGGAAKVARLNFAMPDAGTSDDAAILFTGTVTITWTYNGDN